MSELGKILDPVSDRLAIASLLVALVIRDAFPLWAALLILARDVAVLLAGLFLLRTGGRRIDVRFIGKVATFVLMFTVPAVAWGAFDLPLAATATVVGWVFFGVGIVEYYWATLLYFQDMRALLREGV